MAIITRAELKKAGLLGRLGFDEAPLAKDYHNKRMHEIVGGKECDLRSKLEYRIAKYLQFLKEASEIKDWFYEQTTFKFPDDSWLVDFDVRNNDDTFFYIEAKGLFEADTRRKLKLLSKYRPEVKIVMCFDNKRDAKRVKLSKKYIDKIWVLTKNGVNTIWSKEIKDLQK